MVSKKLRIETIDFRVFMRLLIGVSNAEEYKYLFSFYGEQDQRFGIKSFKMKIPHNSLFHIEISGKISQNTFLTRQ